MGVLCYRARHFSQVTLSAILGQPNVMQGVISDGLASRAAKLQWCRPSAVFFHNFK